MYYKKSKEEIFEEFGSSLKGLKSEEILSLREKFGYNELKDKNKITTLQLFLETFKDPLVIILLIAATVQIATGHFVDSTIIFVVLILNSILSVVQTKKAESSLNALKKLSAPNAKVVRDGHKVVIPARELMLGDVVILESGDYIPADGRLLEVGTLKVMEGILTGESEPILKNCEIINEDNTPLGNRKNMVFSGTIVVYGRGIFIVTAIGMETEIGKIAELLENTEKTETPLQANLEKFTKKLGFGIIGICFLIFFILLGKNYFVTKNPNIWEVVLEAFMFSVAVAVAAIPEALSSIVTIVLSTGTNLMAKKHAIIRKLPAVETLGSTSIICTDKTGTLTQNKMTVVDTYLYGEKTHTEYFMLALTLVNDSHITKDKKEIGDPTEIALVNFALKNNFDVDKVRRDFGRIGELPFDSDRKIMSTVHNINNETIMFVKGAPDVILSRCVGLDSKVLDAYKKKNEEFSEKALRVLALACKKINNGKEFIPTTDDENELTLIGLVAMIDPPREQVFAAVNEAKNAGIKTIMITGDHKTTAVAIAKNIGIMEDGELAFTGAELDALSEEELGRILERISVYARVSPENKIRIVKAWQKKDKITAMTGDGVNDAPALKQANIGIAMGTGTDVSKDAAAMILTDDNFASIVHAIETGRMIYSNIKKAVTYLFVGNLGAILAILFALFAGWRAPFTALQLLFINLINDSLPAIALGVEPIEKGIMNHKPREKNEPFFSKQSYFLIFMRGSFIA
ncbi:MAG: cation-translocating P-type ATPase, partial [Fusobacteriaceae bacterium]